jgi:prolyl-tRNA editing enzyme YbaK/EbsC (Cys-tRNA(Pro) deacylase)
VNELDPRVEASLSSLGVDYEVLECDPDFADTANFCAHYGIPLDHSGNTILVASKKEPTVYAACIVTADTRLDVNKRVRKLLGVSKLSFATAEQTSELTGMSIGGVTAFGLPAELPLYIDSRIMVLDYVILGGGNRSSKLRLMPEALLSVSAAEVVEDLALPAR